MESNCLFFVISSHQEGPKIVQGTIEDFESLKTRHKGCKIRKYTKYEEAKSYLDAYEDMKSNKITVQSSNTPSSMMLVKKTHEISEAQFDDMNLTDEERARLMDIVKDERKKVHKVFQSVYETSNIRLV